MVVNISKIIIKFIKNRKEKDVTGNEWWELFDNNHGLVSVNNCNILYY